MTHTHVTAPTQFVECRGNQFAYRRLGTTEGVPVVFLQHFTGTMDYWDPALVDGFARELANLPARLLVRPGLTGLAQVQLPPDVDL